MMLPGAESLRKVAVVGRGTAGSLAAASVARLHPDGDHELHHIYDSRIPVIGVGEGSWPSLVQELQRLTDLPHETVQQRLNGTRKYGVAFEGWGRRNRDFTHYFTPQQVSYAYHLSADTMAELLHESTRARHIDAKSARYRQGGRRRAGGVRGTRAGTLRPGVRCTRLSPRAPSRPAHRRCLHPHQHGRDPPLPGSHHATAGWSGVATYVYPCGCAPARLDIRHSAYGAHILRVHLQPRRHQPRRGRVGLRRVPRNGRGIGVRATRRHPVSQFRSTVGCTMARWPASATRPPSWSPSKPRQSCPPSCKLEWFSTHA